METPHIVIKVGQTTGLIYLTVDEHEFIFKPDLACDVGEALFKAGADSREKEHYPE